MFQTCLQFRLVTLTRSRQVALVLAGFSLWLLVNRYHGIWHDARLYGVMAMRQLLPDSYVRDPWFAFGSQDGISAFAPLFAGFAARVGLGEAALWLTFIGGAAYVAGAWALVRSCRLGVFGPLAFLVLVSVPLTYCPNQPIFYLTESFATSRPFVVAASLLALAAQMCGRERYAWFFHAIALVLHPLLASGALALAIGVKLPERVTALVILLIPLVMLVLVLADVPAFRAMDAHWLELVAQTGMIVVMPNSRQDQDLILLAAAALLVAAQFGRTRLRSWYAMALIVGFLGYAVTLVASNFHSSALVLQVQTWRSLWLTLVFGVIAVMDLAGQWSRASAANRCGLLLAASALLLHELGGAYGLLIAAIVLRFRRGALPGWFNDLPDIWLSRFGWAVFGTSLATAVPGIYLTLEMRGLGLLAESKLPDVLRGLVDTGGFGVVAVLVWLLLRHLPARAGLLSALVALAAAYSFWDHRSKFVSELENRYRAVAAPEYFADKINKGDVVYWSGNPERVWFELRTASYAGNVQAVGIVFSRRLAFEMERRLARVAQVGIPDEMFGDRRIDDLARTSYALARRNVGSPDDLHSIASLQNGDSLLTRTSLAYICADSALDWVVDSADFPEFAVSRGRIPMPLRGRIVVIDHVLYDCRHFRNANNTFQMPASQ